MLQRSDEIEQFVRAWLDAKQAGDATEISPGLSSYAGAHAVGTECSDGGRAPSRSRTRTPRAWPFTAAVEHLEGHSHGPVGWAAIRATIETGEPGGMPVRVTLVLVSDDDGGWRIVHSHASTPD